MFGCRHGVGLERVARTGAGRVALPCIGHLPPSFIDFLITRGLVEGVLLTGCREGDCHFRRGTDWTEQRIHARRDPYLRRRVPRERVACAWLGTDGERRLREEIERFGARLRETEAARRRPAAATRDGEGAQANAEGGRNGG